MEWYAVNARPHQETVAARNLERLGLETLAPRIRQQKVIGRRRQTVTAPLFPGYLFARFSMGSHYRAVKYARGVRQVVSFGAIPATVDDAIIEGIRERLTDGFVTVARPSFAAGQTVTIRRGPLQGLEAVFERETSSEERVVLLLRTLSYQPRVVVALDDLLD